MLRLLGESSIAPLYEFFFRYGALFLLGFVAPILVINLILKEHPRDFGLTLGPDTVSRKIGFWWMLVLCALAVPVTFLASRNPQLRAEYPLSDFAKTSLGIFMLYQAFYVLAYAGYEFLFRGFLQCGISVQFGRSAIAVQVLATTIIHYQKPFLETLLAFVVGAFAGMLNYRTRSFLYIFIAHAWMGFWLDFWCSFT